MVANFFWSGVLTDYIEAQERKWKSLSYVVLTVKKYKKVCCTSKVVVSLIQCYCFFDFQWRRRRRCLNSLLWSIGWAPFCLLSKKLLARTLDGLLKCFSRDAHCRQTGLKKHLNCMAGEDYCQKLHSFARRFSAKTHDDCRLLRTNPAKFEEKIKGNWSEKPWGGKCHRGHVFCPITMRCIRNDSISNCNANQKFCQKDDESIPWKTSHSMEAGDKFCHRFLRYARVL